MPARNSDRHTPRRERPRPDVGIYGMDRGIYRVRHSKVGDGWYCHRMQVSKHGRIEWAYLGQKVSLPNSKAVLLPVDPDYPVPCSRCPAYCSGQDVIAGKMLCTGCLTIHIKEMTCV